jgi:hypothetical protein
MFVGSNPFISFHIPILQNFKSVFMLLKSMKHIGVKKNEKHKKTHGFHASNLCFNSTKTCYSGHHKSTKFAQYRVFLHS